MCVGSEFQVDGAETENAREVKLLVIPVKKFVHNFLVSLLAYGQMSQQIY